MTFNKLSRLRTMRTRILLSLTTLVLLVAGCTKTDTLLPEVRPATNYTSDVATEWMSTLQGVVQDEGSNPPVASRIYAYAAIGLYESVLPSMSGYRSMQGQVPGLTSLPDSRLYGQLDAVASANEALFQVVSKIFPTLKAANKKRITDLHTKYYNAAFQKNHSDVVYNSVAFGNAVADAVMKRANTDGYADTRSRQYQVPSPLQNPSYWVPTGAVLAPLEPFWGSVKCFTMADAEACTVKSIIPFSTTPGSPFYLQAEEVRLTSLSLTEDQKNIAKWWSDGSSQTATPPGHWVNIIDQLSRRNGYNLGKAAELYAMVNVAMADAFISCWDEKFKMNLLRPVSYIRTYIPQGANWTPLLATPPFPEYPSGHSVASAAASNILTHLLGNIAFTDSANIHLSLPPRSYNSFTQAAEEAAISRLYGGIHFREAIVSGSLQGKEVARVVVETLKLKK